MSKISLTPNASGTGTLSIASPSTNSDYTLTLPAETGTVVVTDGTTLYVDNSANEVGINTASPGATLDTYIGTGLTTFGDFANSVRVQGGNDANKYVPITFGGYGSYAPAAIAYLVTSGSGNTKGDLVFGTRDVTTDTRPTERMRIDSSGNLLVGGTNTGGKITITGKGAEGWGAKFITDITSSTYYFINFCKNDGGATQVGSISASGSTTSYNTSSDYRLKENVAPMTGALATVAALKPVTYTWKADGSAGQGFIAHELQAVVPDCVTGEKDAEREVDVFDEDGNKTGTKMEPVYQGVDTSFLVATLTAAIQELSAKNDALEARIAALEAA